MNRRIESDNIDNMTLALLAWLAFAPAHSPAGPVVKIAGGAVRGLNVEGGAAFKGIPYARPPLGDQRWRPPQPVKPWTGVRDALAFSSACLQRSEGWNDAYAATSSEDCLYLNVATPGWPVKKKFPVMVWIHGGSNTGGSGGTPGFDLRTLVKKGVVEVNINYRLGALGFLAHPELTAESPHRSSGNYGLLDQIAALQWVRANIAKFGGDPGNVTVFGQSAGAFDISLLLASPLSKGLFHRAIAESGAITGFHGPMTHARAEELGMTMAAVPLKVLRTVPAADILKARMSIASEFTGLETNIDGWVLPEPATNLYEAGKIASVPLIIGSNAVEVTGTEVPPAVALLYGAKPLEKGIWTERVPLQNRDPLYGTPGTQWATDTRFRCPAVAQALAYAAAGRPTWQYQFEHPLPGKEATAHSSELGFIFGTFGNAKLQPQDVQLSEQVRGYWTNFARTGDPNGPGLPAWPKFTTAEGQYQAFTDSGAGTKANLRRNFCESH
jgi:para-nitrobenzyl esterase